MASMCIASTVILYVECRANHIGILFCLLRTAVSCEVTFGDLIKLIIKIVKKLFSFSFFVLLICKALYRYHV